MNQKNQKNPALLHRFEGSREGEWVLFEGCGGTTLSPPDNSCRKKSEPVYFEFDIPA
ncbi:MAG: hypothetical protein ACM3YO_09430 [Bacteroidota bacterium]